MITEELRNVALGIVVFLLVFSLLFDSAILVAVAILLVVGTILNLRVVGSVAYWWHLVFTKVITHLSNLLLGSMYLLFITPYSLLYRLYNQKKVKIFLRGPDVPGGYHLVDKVYRVKDLENPW